jgi:hypothetical protein
VFRIPGRNPPSSWNVSCEGSRAPARARSLTRAGFSLWRSTFAVPESQIEPTTLTQLPPNEPRRSVAALNEEDAKSCLLLKPLQGSVGSLDQQNHKQHETDPCSHSQEGKFIGHCVLHQLARKTGQMVDPWDRLAEQQERSARLAHRPPISKRQTHTCGSI